ncbi:UNVERIFIED_CONTAM: Gen1 [Trichonephila clavipes]
MGVTGLWNILSEIREEKNLDFLSGKKVAVDLSGWVVQAILCEGLKTIKNPHLSYDIMARFMKCQFDCNDISTNLFFRVSALLLNGAHPIFILEGKVPELEQATIKARNYQGNSSKDNLSRPLFDKVLKQNHHANMCVYSYSLKSAKNKMYLSRQNLIALALLLGCDYGLGVPGMGQKAALKLIKELKTDWKTKTQSELFPGYEENMKKKSHCSRCSHIGTCVRKDISCI